MAYYFWIIMHSLTFYHAFGTFIVFGTFKWVEIAQRALYVDKMRKKIPRVFQLDNVFGPLGPAKSTLFYCPI